MSYKVKSLTIFEKQAKKLIKKYPSLKNELLDLIEELKVKADIGKALGNNCFKIRLAIASKNRGTSGGARIITNFIVQQDTIYLLTIYDKGAKESINDKELELLLSFIPRQEN
jgi:hypothetical protein